jgi:hypothetical protein
VFSRLLSTVRRQEGQIQGNNLIGVAVFLIVVVLLVLFVTGRI